MRKLSPQGVEIYKLLLEGKALSAVEIGESLKILPQAVYRGVKPLVQLGCVEKVSGRPVKFRAKPVSEAVSAYVLAQREWFEKSFAKYDKKTGERPEKEAGLKISFIQNRQELMEQSTEDLRQTEKEACLLISGHEAPAETVLETKRAIERGATVKMLTQHVTEESLEMYRNWQRMGMQVRSGPTIGARVFIFDARIVYIASYKTGDKSEAVGVRFEYQPIAQLMREVFEQRWEKADEV